MKKVLSLGALVLTFAVVGSSIASAGLKGSQGKKREMAEDTLKDSATAQESWRTGNPSYTKSREDLEAEGLEVPPEIEFRVSMADKFSYCMNAKHEDATHWHHYFSDDGAPTPGKCGSKERLYRELVKDTLKDAATAQESWRISNPSYTENVEDLESEGFYVPYRVQFKVIVATETQYCMEARHPESGGTFHYFSDDGAPVKGQCE